MAQNGLRSAAPWFGQMTGKARVLRHSGRRESSGKRMSRQARLAERKRLEPSVNYSAIRTPACPDSPNAHARFTVDIGGSGHWLIWLSCKSSKAPSLTSSRSRSMCRSTICRRHSIAQPAGLGRPVWSSFVAKERDCERGCVENAHAAIFAHPNSADRWHPRLEFRELFA